MVGLVPVNSDAQNVVARGRTDGNGTFTAQARATGAKGMQLVAAVATVGGRDEDRVHAMSEPFLVTR